MYVDEEGNPIEDDGSEGEIVYEDEAEERQEGTSSGPYTGYSFGGSPTTTGPAGQQTGQPTTYSTGSPVEVTPVTPGQGGTPTPVGTPVPVTPVPLPSGNGTAVVGPSGTGVVIPTYQPTGTGGVVVPTYQPTGTGSYKPTATGAPPPVVTGGAGVMGRSLSSAVVVAFAAVMFL